MLTESQQAEYQSAISGAALFDCSSAGKLTLRGPDAPQFLHNICTNDVKNLPLGGGCETYLCDARAKTLFALWVYHVKLAGDHALWVETTPGRSEALLKLLDRFLISEAVELADVTEQYAQLHLAGPTAKQTLETALGEELPDITEFLHMERTFGLNATCSIHRRDLLGVPGYDIVTLAGRVDGVRRMMTASGAKPASSEVYEVLRIEAGTPIYGIDIDEMRFVMEVGHAARAVSYAKGCFPGQEPIVMARDRAGRVNRSFLGLKLTGEVPVSAKLNAAEQEVGLLTSVTFSPRLHSWLGLGYVHWKQVEVGTVLEVENGQSATVLGYPPIRPGSP